MTGAEYIRWSDLTRREIIESDNAAIDAVMVGDWVAYENENKRTAELHARLAHLRSQPLEDGHH